MKILFQLEFLSLAPLGLGAFRVYGTSERCEIAFFMTGVGGFFFRVFGVGKDNFGGFVNLEKFCGLF